MLKPALRKTIRSLPVEDRIDLFDDLVASIVADHAEIPLQKWQVDMLNERLANYEADPKAVMTLTEFKTKTNELKRELKASSRARRKSR